MVSFVVLVFVLFRVGVRWSYLLGFFRILYIFCYVLVDVFSVEFLDFGVWVSGYSEVWE